MELIHIDKIYPASYNPRNSDPRRIELIKFSIIKLGFLLPVYVNEDYGILSGHQRQIAARQLGIKDVPVEVLKINSLDKEMKINIAFNRGTNDFDKGETTYSAKEFIKSNKDYVFSLIEKMPDKNHENMYPCLSMIDVSSDELKIANRDQFNESARNAYKDLYDLTGVIQPLVITKEMRIVNGVGRFFLGLSVGIKYFKCVIIGDDEAELAGLMLNRLTMDFDFESKYGDILRYNSYRRAHGVRDYLGMAYTIGMTLKTSKNFDIFNPVHRYRFEQVYGKNILDFGAGLMEEVDMLNKNGFKAIPLEPFVLKKREDGSGRYDELDIELARKLINEFLDEVDCGVSFDSIISQTILNSIPFESDRRKYLLLLSFFCDENTTAFIGTNNEKTRHYTDVALPGYRREKRAGNARVFSVEYEKNTTIGDLTSSPKVQKYHTRIEFEELINPYFREIKYLDNGSKVYAICKNPRNNFTLEELTEAIDFEFNLPYPKGLRLNMHERAKKVLLGRAKRIGLFS